MISFIVIGRNEGWKLTKCLKSIYNFIKINHLKEHEIIYVDSKSTDDSIERAGQFEGIKIFQITGECNAAIARNIGAKEASGDIYWFIDGDMELLPDFYKSAFDEKGNLVYDFISGGLINYIYDRDWKLINVKKYEKNSENDEYIYYAGGFFIIKRNLWNQAGGMKTKYKSSQDWDLSLRLSKMGFPLLRKKEIIAIHHTIPYLSKFRKWKLFISLSPFYISVLFRDHFFNMYFYKLLLSSAYSSIILIFCLVFFVIFGYFWILLLYLIIFIFKVIRRYDNSLFSIFGNVIHLLLKDIGQILSFFLFFPKEKKFSYTKIN